MRASVCVCCLCACVRACVRVCARKYICGKKDDESTAITVEAEMYVILAGTATLEPAPPVVVVVTTPPAGSPEAAAAKTVATADKTTIAVQVIDSHYHVNMFPLTMSLR